MTDSLFEVLKSAIAEESPVALATIIECGDDVDSGVAVGAKILVRPDKEPIGTFGNTDLDRVVVRDTLGELSAGTTGVRHYGPYGEARQEGVGVFVESFAPPPQMLIFGAVDFTAALSRVAKILGYRVTVCDARPVFATTQRFPYADEVVVDWPHRLLDKVGPELGQRDAICVLTHDPKFDVPAVIGALKTDIGYLGAMGSRRTTDDRNRRLLEEGVTEAELDRVLAPIGLDLGAATPEETAISICAEIIALRSGRQAPSLRNTSGDIHS
ncbi:MAG: XdhC/CoxI family protein [Actinomycetota bacterium]